MAKQHPKREMTLALDGEVTPQSLADAVGAFARFLDALLQEEAPAVPLEWVITELRAGSSMATAECRAIDPTDDVWIPKVIAGGERFADEMERGVLIPNRSPALREIETSFKGLVKGRLIRVRFETPEKDYILVGEPRVTYERAAPEVAFGSVRGRVQAMSSHGSLRFTLYDINDDRGVSCYLPEGADSEKMMLNLWGALVEVEGFIRRDPGTGKPFTIRDIIGISPIESAPWREAIGASPGFLGDDKSEDIVRRTRDG